MAIDSASSHQKNGVKFRWSCHGALLVQPMVVAPMNGGNFAISVINAAFRSPIHWELNDQWAE